MVLGSQKQHITQGYLPLCTLHQGEWIAAQNALGLSLTKSACAESSGSSTGRSYCCKKMQQSILSKKVFFNHYPHFQEFR